ncbi:MAG TPA: pitrilysin family protein [Candidatus Nanoarchaeia archaeon]|nr:pitrilysin family protein [Candidatus Nanoarchaeia archaeon]
MKAFTLKNGLQVIVEKRRTDTVTIEATVKVGSNQESLRLNGISHFLEHMLFEGTKKRKNVEIISNEVERLGGELNAYTTNERTSYYIKVPKKHFLKALNILSDMIQNSIFDQERVEKERKIILKEINIHKDEPRMYQWDLFQRTLFRTHPNKRPVYGSVKTMKAITRSDLIGYYKKYYAPNNIILSIVGDVPNPRKYVEAYFGDFRKKPVSHKLIYEGPNTKVIIKKERRKILNSYLMLGYKTVPRTHKDSYVLDAIKAILARGQSGKLFLEIRVKRGLAYEVNAQHEASIDHGFFVVYLNTNKKNIQKTVSIILKEFKKLQDVGVKELSEAKGYLEGQFILDNEDTHDRADELSSWALVGKPELFDEYLKEIRKISVKDIVRVSNKYFTPYYAMTVIEQA